MKQRPSIRAQLGAFLAWVLIPAGGLLAFHIYSDFVNDRRAAVATSQRLARSVGANLGLFLVDTEKLLARLTRHPSIARLSANDCRHDMPVFRNLISAEYLNIIVADSSGKGICTALDAPEEGLPNAAERSWFRYAIRTGQFAVGDVQKGRVTGRWVVVLAHPIGDRGAPIGVVGIPVDLVSLETRIKAVNLPAQAVVAVFDSAGNIVTRTPSAEEWIAKSIRGTGLAAAALKSGEGPAQLVGLDGVERIYGFTSVPSAGWHVAVGIPTTVALAEARDAARQAIAAGLLVLTFAAIAGWWMSQRIAKPIRRLGQDAKALAEGELSHRTEVRAPGEIGELAENFNRMAAAIEANTGAFRENAARLKAVIEAEPECVKIVAADGNLLEMNAAGQAMLEADSLEAVRSRPLLHYIAPKHRAAFSNLHERVIAGESGTLEFQVVGLKGGRRWLETHAVPHRAGPNGEIALLGITRDVTAQKQAEEEIRRHLERIRMLQEIERAVTSSLDLESVLQVLLEKIESFVSIASVISVRLVDGVSGRMDFVACRGVERETWSRSRFGRRSRQVLDSRKPLAIADLLAEPMSESYEFFQGEGLISYLGVPLIVKDQALGVLGIYTRERHIFDPEEIDFVRTVADQAAMAIHNARLYEQAQKREAELGRAHRHLSALHSITAMTSRSLDLEQVLRQAIEEITNIFGFDATRIYLYDSTRAKLELRSYFETEAASFVKVPAFARDEGNVGRAAESNEPLIFADVLQDPGYLATSKSQNTVQHGLRFLAAFPIKGKRESLGTLLCIGAAPRTLDESEIRLLSLMTDQIAIAAENAALYREVRERADELQAKTLELERANKIKDEFLSVMSHELRTPLTAISGFVGMMKDGLLGPITGAQEGALEKVLTRAADQLNMINDIMQTTQIEARAAVIDRHEVNVTELLKTLKAEYDATGRSHKVCIVWQLPPIDLRLNTDGTKLRQILQNLINNALKFTATGSVTVSARLTERADPAPSRAIEFTISDTGVGIASSKLAHIFEKFYQVDSSETRLYGGVGLGLYIVNNFVKLLGGRVDVQSECGKGSTFTVTLPYE